MYIVWNRRTNQQIGRQFKSSEAAHKRAWELNFGLGTSGRPYIVKEI